MGSSNRRPFLQVVFSYPHRLEPGLLEVIRILNGGREGRRGDRAHPGNRHKDATGLVLARTGNKLTPEFSGTEAQAAPRFQHRQHSRSEPFLVDKKTADIL